MDIRIRTRGSGGADMGNMNETYRFAYIGTEPCGCTVAACVDDPKWAKHTAEAVADMIKGGLKVERVTVEESRIKIKACHCNDEPKLFDS